MTGPQSVPGGWRPGLPPGPPAPPRPTAPAPAADHDGGTDGTHPAVEAVLRSLANAATLSPADQVAEYEAAHQVLQETLASIDRA